MISIVSKEEWPEAPGRIVFALGSGHRQVIVQLALRESLGWGYDADMNQGGIFESVGLGKIANVSWEPWTRRGVGRAHRNSN